MKKFFLAIFLFCSSCAGIGGFDCFSPSEYDKNTAQSYYETFGTSMVSSVTHNKVKKKFGCHYRAGDKIYAYQTFWGVKYILVRHGHAVTYVE